MQNGICKTPDKGYSIFIFPKQRFNLSDLIFLEFVIFSIYKLKKSERIPSNLQLDRTTFFV